MDAGAGFITARVATPHTTSRRRTGPVRRQTHGATMVKKTNTTTKSKNKSAPGHDNPPCRDALKAIDYDNDGYIVKADLTGKLAQCGLDAVDPRLKILYTELGKYGDREKIELPAFAARVRSNNMLLTRALRGELVLPQFSLFTEDLAKVLEIVCRNKKGKVADYIPQLAKVDPEKTALAVCTVDGQTFASGDCDDAFCLQSTCKPLLYALALEGNDEQTVHRHIGREPSGVSFNALSLNAQGLPHNPMINAGAIMSCSLIKPGSGTADRFEHFTTRVQAMAGEHHRIGFENSVYQSEKETGNRNFALGYFMKEKNAFPANTEVVRTLELYFQCCSVMSTTTGLAAIGATLANAGVQPHSGRKLLSPASVKNCLSLMLTCGMYDYSGEWAFLVGLPAKSGVSGALLAVVPGVMGICLWSPRLNEQGNTVRGIEFFTRLSGCYNFHHYDSVIGATGKRDPRVRGLESSVKDTLTLLSAASTGDMAEIINLVARGVDLNSADYDGRTAAHLAASEGQTHVLEYLIAMEVKLDPVDRWHGTPLDDAKRENHEAVVRLLSANHR